MKSILQEANSIERAIDKAWNEAGKPKEFTIRVLDEGERNFLGLSRRPAIVSIFYKPEKVTSLQWRKEKTEERPASESRDRNHKQRRDNRTENSTDSRSEVGGYSRRQDDEGQRPRRYAGTEQQRTNFQQQKAAVEGWSDEWQQFVLNEIKDLVKRMGFDVVADAAVTGDKILTVTFKKALLDNDDEQRMLFATFSYLAIQLLKRTYKSRFVGYRIAVTGPKADGSAMSADSEEQIHETAEMRSGHKRTSQNVRRDQQQAAEGGRPVSTGNKDRRGGDRRPRQHDRSDRQDRPPRIQQPTEQHEYSAPHGHGDDIIADQMKFAQQQLNGEAKREEKRQLKPAAAPLKKDQKYQPFFVIEDEESGK